MRWKVALCGLLLCVAALGCEKKEEVTAPPVEGGEVKPVEGGEAKPAEGGEAKPAEGGEAKPVVAAPTLEIPVGFDPLKACGASPLDPASIPPLPVIGTLVKNEEEAPSLIFKLVSGRAEVREDKASLRLASEALKDCSPFLVDGGLAKEPRLAAAFSSLEKKAYFFPDKEEGAFKYWNYVYTTDKETPFTVNAFSSEDKGVVVIDEIDQANQKVTGRMLLCKDGGKKGWAAGNFEVPICDKRPVQAPTPEKPAKNP
jgi:hypothetical protein